MMKLRGYAVWALCVALLPACRTSADHIVVTGRVDDIPVVVAAPALSAPALNLDAGFELTPEQIAAQPPVRPATASRFRVAQVRVSLGERVTAGQVLVRLDDAALRAALGQARAERRLAGALVDLVDQRLATASTTATTLTTTRRTIVTQLAKVPQTRALLSSNLASLRAALASIPVIPETATKRAALRKAIATLTAALRKLEAGVVQARAGLARIDQGLAGLATARSALSGAHRIAEAQVQVAASSIEVGRQQRRLTVLRAPESGIVTSVAAPGTVLAPGAPVVRLRGDQPRTITVWISPRQAAQVCPGVLAMVSADWTQEGLGARVTAVGDRADYPPTRQPTRDVHLTRAVPLTLRGADWLPPGVPLDLWVPTSPTPCPAHPGSS